MKDLSDVDANISGPSSNQGGTVSADVDGRSIGPVVNQNLPAMIATVSHRFGGLQFQVQLVEHTRRVDGIDICSGCSVGAQHQSSSSLFLNIEGIENKFYLGC